MQRAPRRRPTGEADGRVRQVAHYAIAAVTRERRGKVHTGYTRPRASGLTVEPAERPLLALGFRGTAFSVTECEPTPTRRATGALVTA